MINEVHERKKIHNGGHILQLVSDCFEFRIELFSTTGVPREGSNIALGSEAWSTRVAGVMKMIDEETRVLKKTRFTQHTKNL